MLIERMLRAARLDLALYNEVEHDTNATTQAFLVVLIAAVATGLGELLSGSGAGGLVAGVLRALIGWVVWSYVTYFVGTRVFGGTATPSELLRTLGFATTPQVLNVLGFIPIVGALIRLAVFFWLLVAGFLAVREALDLDTGKAVGTVVVGWLALVVLAIIQAVILGTLGLATRLL